MSWLFGNSSNGDVGNVDDVESGGGSGFFSAVPSFGGGGDDNESADDDSCSWCVDLSYQTRLYGFMICFGLGTFLSISSSFFVGSILLGKPGKFVVPYTLGNVFSLSSSAFFVGPKRFAQTMFTETRRAASIIYLISLALTLFVALYLHFEMLTFLCIVVQFASYLWLMASYIPFGRRMLSSMTSSAISMVSS